MQEDFKTIREILIKLLHHYWSCLGYDGLPSYHAALHSHGLTPMSDRNEIYYIMNDKDGRLVSCFPSSGKFFYLPPTDRTPDFVPILFLDCDLDKSKPKIAYNIMLCRCIQIKDDAGEVHQKIERMGFRFEAPHEGETRPGSEESETESAHDYWHMQLIEEITGETRHPDIVCRHQFPTKIPCVPVRARCPVSLLLCMLFSFYGKDIISVIQTEDPINEKYMEPLAEMLSVS